MHEHKEFLEEKEQIDRLINNGFFITDVTENLEGAFVQFSNGADTEQLHIQSASARKYFSFLLKKQKEDTISPFT
ncbi:hypothetical protein [Alteribacillus sp. YIM 98480]|uniref:hypothetical protein n=1 Tax=Alteribacillus sp. YIM 98480 TaxID=2606599 RepID=UPI00131BE47D|nr:hypothetical protein [Alteribacillus sp. YIM 98480]